MTTEPKVYVYDTFGPRKGDDPVAHEVLRTYTQTGWYVYAVTTNFWGTMFTYHVRKELITETDWTIYGR